MSAVDAPLDPTTIPSPMTLPVFLIQDSPEADPNGNGDPTDPDELAGSGLRHTFETPDGPITIDLANPNERFRAIANRLGLEFWDVLEGFHERATASPERFAEVFPDRNRHWTWAGHEIVAELVTDRVAEHLRRFRERD